MKAMIRDSNVDGNDSILIEYYGLDDIDPDSLRQYRTEFRQENRTHVWNRVDDKTFLRNLGGYAEDRQTGREGLTLAGLMMFGKGLAISFSASYHQRFSSTCRDLSNWRKAAREMTTHLNMRLCVKPLPMLLSTAT